jgi:hypothetical protein
MLDCFANSFADAVIRAWVPMAQDPDVFGAEETPMVPVTRYTGLMAYN